MSKCCRGAELVPNQASLVMVVSSWLPCRTAARDSSG